MNDSLTDRLNLFILHLKSSVNLFENEVGINKGTIQKAIKKGTALGVDKIQKIMRKHPELNINWLFTGVGDMLANPSDKNVNLIVNPIVNPKGNLASEPHTDYSGKDVRILPITLDNTGKENIVLVPAKAAAGYPVEYRNPAFFNQFPTFSLPNATFRNGTFRGFEVKGNSMEPAILPGSIVIGRYVDDWLSIKDGLVYIVVTTDGVLVKRVLNRIKQREQLSLKSENLDYSTVQVDISAVLELWLVVGELRFQFKTTQKDMLLRVSNLEADYHELRTDFDTYLNKRKR